jgi:hypothetical protein
MKNNTLRIRRTTTNMTIEHKTRPKMKPTKNRLVKLYRFARLHGPARAFYRLTHRLSEFAVFRPWLRFGVVEVYRAAVADLKQGGAIPRSFEVRRATAKDEPSVALYFEDASLVRERFRRGDTCVVTLAKGRVCAAVWFCTGPNQYGEDWSALKTFFRAKTGAAWSFDGKGTRMGAWGALMTRFPGLLAEEGNREVYTVIDFDNLPSIEGHRSLGYERVGLFTCFSALGFALRLFRPDHGKWQFGRGQIGNVRFDGRRRDLNDRTAPSWRSRQARGSGG